MRKVIFLALLAVVFVAMPAFASVQNIKISGDIETTYLMRDEFDLNDEDPGEAFTQNLFITQTRLRVDADLTDNVSATVALLNERAWGRDENTNTQVLSGGGTYQNDADQRDDINLNLAYVTLREMLYSPLTVIVGRQAFSYGNSFVIDSAGTNNVTNNGGLNNVAEDLTKGTALDAVRAILDYNPLTVDIVYAKVDSNNLLGTGAQDDDEDLYGINANYQLGDDMNTVVEGYFWAKTDQNVKAASAGAKANSIYMPGLRVASSILDGLNVSTEVAWQFGSINDPSGTDNADNINRSAMAAQVITTYALPFDKTKEYKPMVLAHYTYASGDSNPAEWGNNQVNDKKDTYTAWDPMLENQGGGKIYNTLADLTNVHIVGVGANFVPIEDVTLGFEWTGLWLDKAQADPDDNGETTLTIRQPDGTTNSIITDTDKGLGFEYDWTATYDYTEDVQFKASYGLFYPGTGSQTFQDGVAKQAMVSALVSF